MTNWWYGYDKESFENFKDDEVKNYHLLEHYAICILRKAVDIQFGTVKRGYWEDNFTSTIWSGNKESSLMFRVPLQPPLSAEQNTNAANDHDGDDDSELFGIDFQDDYYDKH
mmetsp:Transcript_13093/g.14030  ORF Transcript_13093/g.14030 Transcript_13093/m.14030 type:complete len:112 (-) Transcript_13093:10-345(-)